MSLALRRAPADGYEFDQKDEYRHHVWRAFADAWGEQLAEKRALLMPSKEGLEIPVALDWGASEHNIVAVDSNPAIIATARWRSTYPDVTAMGSSIGRAADRLAADGVKLSVANLDLCNKFSRPLVSELRQFAAADVLADTAVVSVTLMKGREHSETTAALSIMAERCGLNWNVDAGRPFVAMLFMSEMFGDRAWVPFRSGEYRSGSKNMVWLTALTVSKRAMRKEMDARVGAVPVHPRIRWAHHQMNEHAMWRTKRWHHRSSYAKGVLRGRDGIGGLFGWNDPNLPSWGIYGKFARDLKDQFRRIGPVGADEYVTAMFDSHYERRAAEAELIIGEWSESCASVPVPWTSEWRGAPRLGQVVLDTEVGQLTTDRLSLSATTQPLNTWLINDPRGVS